MIQTSRLTDEHHQSYPHQDACVIVVLQVDVKDRQVKAPPETASNANSLVSIMSLVLLQHAGTKVLSNATFATNVSILPELPEA